MEEFLNKDGVRQTVQGIKDYVDTTKQETLIAGENIKNINGNSLLGAGNIEINTYQPFPVGWTTNSTTKALLDCVRDDASAVVGMAYLGEVTCSDLPFSGNAEITIEIMKGTTSSSKVIVATLTSGNVAPYYWQYTYWNSGSSISSWKTFISADNNIPEFSSSISYVAGDLVTYRGIFYRCSTAHSGSWNASDFIQVNLKDLFDEKANLSDLPRSLTIQEVRDTAMDVLYPALPAPTNVTASGTDISFDEVQGAESYVVYANGNEIGRVYMIQQFGNILRIFQVNESIQQNENILTIGEIE